MSESCRQDETAFTHCPVAAYRRLHTLAGIRHKTAAEQIGIAAAHELQTYEALLGHPETSEHTKEYIAKERQRVQALVSNLHNIAESLICTAGSFERLRTACLDGLEQHSDENDAVVQLCGSLAIDEDERMQMARILPSQNEQ